MRGTEEQPVQPEKPALAWSHSALDVYLTCPRKYYEAKVTKAWVEEFKGPAAEWGTAVHKAFERRIKFGSPFPPNMVQWEALAHKLAGQKGVIHLEMQLALNEQLEKVDWFAKDVWCRTIIDYACINQKTGNALILDYKTGKKKDDDRQLALMAAVIFEVYPNINKIVSGYLWLKDGQELAKATFLREHKGKLWNQYLPTVQAVQQSMMTGQWPEKPSGLCYGWCPVQDCKNWQPKRIK